MRLDLRLQRFHARFQHRALELLGFRPLRGFVGSQLRPALAARHHLDDDSDATISIKTGSGCLNMPASISPRSDDEQQLLPRHDRQPVEESPPHQDDAIADLTQGLPGSAGSRNGAALAALGGVFDAWAAWVSTQLVALWSPAFTAQDYGRELRGSSAARHNARR